MKKGLAWPLGAGAAASMMAALVVAAATGALAHEERTTGGLQFVVGWGDEPAYTGSRNSVEVAISDAGGRPVTDLGDALQVEVIKGSEKVTLPLEADFGAGSGTPGNYRAWLTPTRPGSYTFHLIGTVRGQRVDDSFTSSPTTFDEVQDVANIQFPAKDPSTGELATRIDREIPRIETRADAVEAAVADAEERAASARTLAMVAIVTGVLGLLSAAVVLVAGRRDTSRRGGRKVGPSTSQSEQAGSLNR